MGILGKDLLDYTRPHTHTKVLFGEAGYWVESFPERQPYGAVLTEVLNLDIQPLQAQLDSLDRAVQERDPAAVSRAETAVRGCLSSLPLYRLYWKELRPMRKPEADQEDPLCGFVRRQLDDIRLIQRRYGWFLRTLSEGQPFEKKKGQRKLPLARQITNQLLEPYVSGVSLGEDAQADAPQVNIQYAVLERESCEPDLVEKMYFDRLLDFVYVEFMRGLQKGFLPKQCANCGRWFLQKPGATYHYCDQPAPGQGDRTCREIGAAASFQDKVRNNEIWRLHQRAYKKYFARTRKGTMGRREFETWAREAEQLRDQALAEYARAEAAEAKSGIVTELEQALNKI